jgi:hypothetical protein
MDYLNFSLSWVMLFLLQVFLVSFVSKNIFESLFILSRWIFNDRNLSIYIVSFIFLPGTLIHELSHVMITLMVGGRVGKINLWPQIENDHIKLGTAEVQVMDPFRNSLVGVSPLLIGSALIVYLSSIFQSQSLEFQILIGYFIFQISNSMFLSPSDIKEFKYLFLFGLIILILTLVYFYLNSYDQYLNVIFEFLSQSVFLNELKNLNLYFGLTVLLNLPIFIFGKLFIKR